MLTNQVIVSFSHNRWYGKWSEKQAILTKFAEHGNRCLLVEHPFPVRAVLAGRVPESNFGLNRVNDKVYYYVPSRFHPSFSKNHPVLNRLTRDMRIRAVHRALRQLGWARRPILYIWHPDFLEMVGRFNESCLLYHKFDRYPIVGEPSPDLLRRERELIDRADVCMTVSHEIIAMDPMFSGFEFMPNAAEFEAFQAAFEARGRNEPADLASIPHPRVGYVGAINRKIDFDLMQTMAERMPDASFVLVGPEVNYTPEDAARVAKLKQRDNVHFLGLKGFDELPRYVANLDAGIIINTKERAEWVKYCYPLKLHEYLAAGLPVVSTDIPAVREFSDVVRIATGADQWIAAIRACLAESGPEVLTRRIEIARQNSWASRVERISELVERSMGNGNGRR